MTIDERIASELRRHAPQVDEPAAWDRIRSAVPARRRGRVIRLVSVAVAAFGFVLLGFVLLPNLSSGPPPASEPTTPDAIWPQSSLEEVQEAQKLADEGDPDYTWQLEPALEDNLLNLNGDYLGNPEIFARFLREELGWEEFYRLPGVMFGDGKSGPTIFLNYVRCAPGQSNAIYPDDPSVGRCAPTIDEFRYETVAITVAQPGLKGPSGIWVVTQWENLEPVEQVVPLTESEATEIVEAFLQARIDGEGAEQYFGGGGGTAPLLYATSTGAPYERYELQQAGGAEWPEGWRGFEVRLFAEDGQTVVEQSLSLERDRDGRWGLENEMGALENGQEAFPGLHHILGGEVTFYADPPWEGSFFGPNFETNGHAADTKLNLDPVGRLYVLADPLPVTGCQEGPAAADAPALAQSILSNDDFEATTPVAMTIGGAPALRMDLVMTAGPLCGELPRSHLTSAFFDAGDRVRLYLVDLPEGSSAGILAVAIGAPGSQFNSVVEAAIPVVDSIEFHTG